MASDIHAADGRTLRELDDAAVVRQALLLQADQHAPGGRGAAAPVDGARHRGRGGAWVGARGPGGGRGAGGPEGRATRGCAGGGEGGREGAGVGGGGGGAAGRGGRTGRSRHPPSPRATTLTRILPPRLLMRSRAGQLSARSSEGGPVLLGACRQRGGPGPALIGACWQRGD